MNRVAVTVGARAVQETLGYTGAGIGVAVIDSGITTWHDDLTYSGTSSVVKTKNGQRVAAFVDFVNNHTSPYDDNGHGTHVAGIIAGNGYDTRGARAGIAPSAHLVGLKVLDRNGPRRHQRRDCRHRLGGHEQGALQHPRHQPVGWRGGHRVVHHRPAHAGGQARRRCRHRRRDGGWQPGQERPGAGAVRRHHGAGQRALGADGRRLEPRRHGVAHRRQDGRLQLAWSLGHRLPGQAGSGRAGHGHRIAVRSDEPDVRLEGVVPVEGFAHRYALRDPEAVSEPHGHQHGVAGRCRHASR